jgi:hypothetical protein
MGCALVYWGADVARFSMAMQQLQGMTLDLQLLRSRERAPVAATSLPAAGAMP